MPSEHDVKAPPQESLLASSPALRQSEPGPIIGGMRAATLDDEAFQQTRDGYERAEMFQLTLRASLNDVEISLIDEGRRNDPFRLAYYPPIRSLLKTKTLSGVVLLREKQDLAAQLGRACSTLHDVEPFDVARLTLANYRKSDAIWATLIRRSAGKPLLMIGLPKRTREILPLAETYEKFLKSLGKYTRRNVRKTRERADALAIRFALFPNRPPDDYFGKILEMCKRNGPRPVPESEMLGWEQRISRQNGHFYSTLATKDGYVFSFCRGFIWGKSAIIPYQLNDRDYYDKNPSLLHRAFLAESLMQRGVREMIFPNGCAGLLKNVCLPDVGSSVVVLPLSVVALVKAAVTLSLRAGALLAFLGTLLPGWLRRRLGMQEL